MRARTTSWAVCSRSPAVVPTPRAMVISVGVVSFAGRLAKGRASAILTDYMGPSRHAGSAANSDPFAAGAGDHDGGCSIHGRVKCGAFANRPNERSL